MTDIRKIFGYVIFTSASPDDTIKQTLEQAVKAGVSLAWANLTGADLRGADLTGADLRGAVLWVANLRMANLRGTTITLGNTAFKLDKPEACDD